MQISKMLGATMVAGAFAVGGAAAGITGAAAAPGTTSTRTTGSTGSSAATTTGQSTTPTSTTTRTKSSTTDVGGPLAPVPQAATNRSAGRVLSERHQVFYRRSRDKRYGQTKAGA